MIRRPPNSTRTVTRLPDTALFRSYDIAARMARARTPALGAVEHDRIAVDRRPRPEIGQRGAGIGFRHRHRHQPLAAGRARHDPLAQLGRAPPPAEPYQARTEESRVGQECVSTCEYRGSPYQ